MMRVLILKCFLFCALTGSMAYNMSMYGAKIDEGDPIGEWNESPKQRLSKNMELLEKLFSESKLSFQVLCIAGHCLVVEIPLGVAMLILTEFYLNCSEYPLSSFLVMLPMWWWVMKKLVHMGETISKFWQNKASSSGERPAGSPWYRCAGRAQGSKLDFETDVKGKPDGRRDQALYFPPPTAPHVPEVTPTPPPTMPPAAASSPTRQETPTTTAPVSVTVMTTSAESQDETIRRIVREEMPSSSTQQTPAVAPIPAPIPAMTAAEVARGQETLRVAQQSGKNLSWVHDNEKSYATYLMSNTRLTNPQLLRFKEYRIRHKARGQQR